MNKQTTIKITLRSDLCVGSGYSYAGVIDSDVTADNYGIPYIPARRLKGCMKEAAEMINTILQEDTIQELFGNRGQKAPGKLVLENARINHYEEITNALRSNKYSKEAILQQFTTVRAQTKIDESGIAEDNSLRFMRVVSETSPLTRKGQLENLTFYATVTYPEEYENDLVMILQATRSIGMNRNRGLGSVTCELDVSSAKTMDEFNGVIHDSNEPIEIHYSLLNEEPLMISLGSDNVSETYIPGRMILGALAAKYLSIKGHTADDTAFRDLFLNGEKTQFLNVYISNGDTRCIPVPGYVNSLKKSKNLVNFERIYEAPSLEKGNTDDEIKEYGVAGGNQPKKLLDQYCAIDKDSHNVSIKEVGRQLTYHHRHKHGKDEVQLYSHLEIAEGQKFVGVIRTTAAYKDLITQLLSQGLRIGKSRSAQYGKCQVVVNNCEEIKPDTIEVKSGEDILVSFSAPSLFVENGKEVACYEEVYTLVAKALGIEDKVGPTRREEDGINPFGIIDTKLIYGYQSIWNLRRTPSVAVTEGSVLVYRMKEDASIDRNIMVGNRHLEGYGEIHVERMNDFGYRLEKNSNPNSDNNEVTTSKEVEALIARIDYKKNIEDKMEFIRSDETQKYLRNITSSALGRITLMLREALESSDNPQEQYEDYLKRINSIKTDNVQKIGKTYAEKCNPNNLGDLASEWGLIALEGLTCQKYRKKQEGKE